MSVNIYELWYVTTSLAYYQPIPDCVTKCQHTGASGPLNPLYRVHCRKLSLVSIPHGTDGLLLRVCLSNSEQEHPHHRAEMLRPRSSVKRTTGHLLTAHLAALLTILTGYKAMSADPSPPPGPSLPRAGVSGVLKDRPFHATFEITGLQPPPGDPPWISEMFR